MKKISKILAMVLTLALMVALMAGCGDSKEPTTTNPPAENTGDANTPATNEPTEKPVDDKVYTIKFDYPNPESSVAFRALTAWSEYLKEESNGRLDIKIYSSGALGALPDCVSNCESGVTDAFWSGVTIYAGVFPLTEVFGLPMLGAKNYKVINDAMNAMYEESTELQEEWSNLHLVALHSSAGSPILFADEISSIQDMAGKNLRISNAYTTKWFEDHGVNPVSCGINDGYENIQKSVIQGGLFFFDQVESSALYEVIKSIYVGQTIYPLNMICLNKDVYEGLPADLQELIDNSADYYLEQSIAGFDEQQENMLKVCEEHGVKILHEDEASIEWLSEGVEDAWAAWVAKMNEQGHDGQAILDTALEYIEEYNANY